MANAGELIIDDRLVKQIERVDKALEKIHTTMDITTPNINELFDAFRNQEGGGTLVGLDLNDFVKKLKEIQKTMDAVGANSKRGKHKRRNRSEGGNCLLLFHISS